MGNGHFKRTSCVRSCNGSYRFPLRFQQSREQRQRRRLFAAGLKTEMTRQAGGIFKSCQGPRAIYFKISHDDLVDNVICVLRVELGPE